MKGICFIEPLFHKVVKGEKTQTRRIITNEDWMNQSHIRIELSDDNCFAHFISNNGGEAFAGKVAKYAPHEKVYLKEPYFIFDEEDNSCFYKYLPKVDWLTDKEFSDNVNSISRLQGWKNKLFMPESAARYFIEITAVRAERLQDITEADCIKEGIDRIDFPAIHFGIEEGEYFNWLGNTPQEAYAALINKINGKGTWEENPFVWVYDFKLTQ